MKIYHPFIIIFTVFAVFTHTTALSQCTTTLPARVPLGANLNELTDYSRDRPFNDVFKLSRPFSANITQPFNFSAVPLDVNGWPKADFGVVVMTEMDSTMGGTYRIQFKGQATIAPVSGSGFTVTGQLYNAANNITTANLVYPARINNSGTMFIGFTNTRFSATEQGVKNIKIMKPGLSFSAPTFSQRFLSHLQRFDCLRFMDWHETNNNGDSLYANRTKKIAPSQQTPNGAAWEYVIELANTLQKDVWINIPHRADNGYITSLARLLRDSLQPGLKIYVEYSNELWNGQFSQTQWISEKSIAEGNKTGSKINFDNVNDQFTWRSRYVALRSKEISDLFKAAFGAAELNNRFRVVLPQQFGFFDFTVRGVDFINAFFGKPSNFFYALAVAPYFATNELDAVNAAATKNMILSELNKQSNRIFQTLNNSMDMWAARAAFYNLKLVAYEGGPDMFGGNNIASKIAANRDSVMRTICIKYLTRWYNYGFTGLFNWYSAGAADYNTPFGSWAITETFDSSQKLKAIDSVHKFLTPGINAGQAVTGNIDPRRFTGYGQQALNDTFFQPTNGFPEFYEYLIRVPAGKSGNYRMSIATCANSSNQSYKVALDDSTLATVTPVNNNFTSFVFVSINTQKLQEGLHAIRITPVGGFSFRIKSIRLTLTAACTGLTAGTITSEAAGAGAFITSAVVYPNPSVNKTAVLNYTLAKPCNVLVQVTDINGRVVKTTHAGLQPAGNHQMPLQAQNLPQSIYFVRLLAGDKQITVKWLVE